MTDAALSDAARRPPGGALHERALARDHWRERLILAGLGLPALVFVLALLLGPLAWMFAASFHSESGLTLTHYAQLLNPDNQRYLTATFQISAIVTAICLVLSYPACYALINMPARYVGFCMLFVIIPFLTSILVRTYAWLVILQRRGIINTVLIDLGLIDQPLQLVYNYTGTVIGMVHVLLPLTLLPLYGVLKTLDRDLLKAAASLGAGPTRAFWTVFFPLSLPGLAGGAAMTFVIALGFFVTPAVLGGGRVILWSNLVESTVNFNPDWGAASALGMILLALTLAVLAIAGKVFGLAVMKRS